MKEGRHEEMKNGCGGTKENKLVKRKIEWTKKIRKEEIKEKINKAEMKGIIKESDPVCSSHLLLVDQFIPYCIDLCVEENCIKPNFLRIFSLPNNFFIFLPFKVFIKCE